MIGNKFDMNIKKRLLLLILLLSVLLSGCNYPVVIDGAVLKSSAPQTEPVQQIPEEIIEPIIGFSETETEDLDKMVQVLPEELQSYTSEFSDYSSYTYFHHLNDTDKLLYHAYEYALDQGLPYIWMDERLLYGMERSAFEILEFLSLDSAMVEQNIEYVKDSYVKNGETYTTFFLEDFTKARLKHKKDAVLQAKLILYHIEGYQYYSHRELARLLYIAVGNSMGYTDDVPNGEYLYAGLCECYTNCDGFANAFALVCRLAEIPCIEVNSDDQPGEEGHTWNMVLLDGQWVYVDPTGSYDDAWSHCDNRIQNPVCFGFSFNLLRQRVRYSDLIPSCPNGVMSVLNLPSQRNPEFINSIRTEFAKNGGKFAVVLLQEGEIDDQTIQELVDAMNCDLHYVSYQNIYGRTVYHLYNNE